MSKHRELKMGGVVAAAVALALFGAPASAEVLGATNFGTFSETGSHVGYNYNIGTGYSGPGNNLEFRSFFTFDLASVSANIGDATLHLWNSTPAPAPPGYLGYNSADLTETINIYSVTTISATDLSNNAYSQGPGAVGAGIFGDLGNGTLLGSLTVSKSASGPGSFADIVFNAAGVAEINANAGGKIAFGGALGSLTKDPLYNEFLFSGWANNDLSDGVPYPYRDSTHAQLAVNPVPLPGAVWLLGSALAGLGAMRRRKLAAVAA